MSLILLLLLSSAVSPSQTAFHFPSFSLEGWVTSQVAFFYGIPYSSPLIRGEESFLIDKPAEIFQGRFLLKGTFQSRTFDPQSCLGRDGSPTKASLCLDVDIFVPSPVSEGDFSPKCPQESPPSFTFVWHVDVNTKNRTQMEEDAIHLARDMNALVVVVYYRSGVLGFNNIVDENVGFEDIRRAYLLVVDLSRLFCVTLDRIVYSGYSRSASDLSFLAMGDNPYSGMYALFGPYFQIKGAKYDDKIEKLKLYYSCDNKKFKECLAKKFKSVDVGNFSRTQTQLDSFGPWFPRSDSQPLTEAQTLPVLYGFTSCDPASLMHEFHHKSPPTSYDELIESIREYLPYVDVGNDDDSANSIFEFYKEARNYEKILGNFLHDIFALKRIWNSSLEVLSETTFVNFSEPCSGLSVVGGQPLFPFSREFGGRTEVIDLITNFVEYNTGFVDSEWNFSRAKTMDTLVGTVGVNGDLKYGFPGNRLNLEFLSRGAHGRTLSVARILLIFLAGVSLVAAIVAGFFWRRSRPTRITEKGWFSFPGVTNGERNVFLKNGEVVL